MKIFSFAEADHASTYYRMTLPAHFMSRDAITNVVVEANWQALRDDERKACKNIIQTYDMVRFARFADWEEIIRYANRHGIPTIYSTDDYFFIGEENPLGIASIREKWAERCQTAAQLCDGVIVSTEALREAYLQYNSHVYMAPNCLDYEQKQWRQPRRKPDGRIIIGYYGSPTHAHDLKAVAGVITELMKKYDNLEFHYGVMPRMGVMYNKKSSKGLQYRQEYKPDNPVAQIYYDLSADMPPDRVRFLDYRGIQNYGVTYAGFDIAIAPLNDTPLNYYKSNLKLLEAGAYNLPVVCSAIRPFVETIVHGVDGFLAINPGEFRGYLEELIGDVSLRQRIGAALGEKVRLLYNIRTQYRRWIYYMDAIMRSAKKKKQAIIQPGSLSFVEQLKWRREDAISKRAT
jgi:glycosyltransferase involved in cell wall biosynthesis